MPPAAKITKEMILASALELIRQEGHQRLTARRLAEKMGCSTQPILYQFASIRALTEAAYARADAFHTAYLTDGLEREEKPLLALGLRYIRFGAEEPALFRFLFQSGEFSGKTLEEITEAPEAQGLIALAAEGRLSREAALRRFRTLFCAVHGYASLLANNAMRWDVDQAREMLEQLHGGLEKADEEGGLK